MRVAPVEGRRDLKRFIDLPQAIYRGDPHWVPPLRRDVRAAFDPTKHPFHRHSEAQPYLAWRGGEVVGRICAIRNRRHEATHDEAVGFFGWFEAVDDHEVAAALLETAGEWVRARGLTAMRGPVSFSTNETCGVLIDGDPGPPVIMMAHNPPYYPALLEGAGLAKAKDLWAWHLAAGSWPEKMARTEKVIARRSRVSVRTLDMSRFDEELELVRTIYNAAWERNWGFVPMTDAEMDHMAAELKPVLEPKLALFAENADGETIGFALALPDFNRVLKLLNGRLTPWGLARALAAKRRIGFARVIILGLLEEWRGKGLDLLLYLGLFRNGAEVGYREGELSWILEDNRKMNAAIERMGARVYRTYRLYERPL